MQSLILTKGLEKKKYVRFNTNNYANNINNNINNNITPAEKKNETKT